MELTFHPDGKCEDPRYEGILMANGEAEEFPLVSKLNPGGATSSTKEPLRHPTMDGDISTFWQTDCKPCAREKAWLGLDIMEVVDVQCFRIFQEGYVPQMSRTLLLQSWDRVGWKHEETLFDVTGKE